jgi:hypothetical protein
MRATRLSVLGSVVLVLVLLLTLALVSPATGDAKAGTFGNGTPELTSTYIVGDGSALVFVGANDWANAWSPETNDSQIYTNQLVLLAFDLHEYNVTLYLAPYEQGFGYVGNQSILLSPDDQATITVTFPSDTNWENVVLYMDGTPFVCQVATPISLLPPSLVNVGGVDILALAIISEGIIVSTAMMGCAKWLHRRTVWAPKFSLLFWGHGILIGMLAAVVIDYQWVDQTFAGWSPLVYAFAVAPAVFFQSLSWFNKGYKVELLQPVARAQGEMVYRRWLLRMGTLGDGRVILIVESWKAWLARVFGHYIVVDEGDPSLPKWFEALVENYKSQTKTAGKTKASDRFKITNPQDDEVERLLWTDTAAPVTVKEPVLTVHRMVTVPARVSAEGQTLRPERTERRLSLPHFTEAEVQLVLAPEHFKAAAAVAAGWANLTDLARVRSKEATDLYVTKASFHAQVEAEIESRLTAYFSLIGRTNADLTDEEAGKEAQQGAAPSLADLLDEKALRARGQAPTEPTKGKKGAA